MSHLKKVLLGAVLWLGLFATFTPADAQIVTDNYWQNHWNWYDNTYQPYYARRYYYNNPGYYGGRRNYYRQNYYYPRGYNYGRGYGYPYQGGGVRVGPLQFDWW